MYAENTCKLVAGLEELVAHGDAQGLLREIRRAVILMAIEGGHARRQDLADGLQEIVDTLQASLDA